ncbi:uncharacterized protein METZ01_LOCUS481097, partial [marine metagenome]
MHDYCKDIIYGRCRKAGKSEVCLSGISVGADLSNTINARLAATG